MLSPAQGKVTHVLLTRAPLYRGRSPFSFDLHVLGAPLTFVLSQDQTLQLKTEEPVHSVLPEGRNAGSITFEGPDSRVVLPGGSHRV